MTTPTTRTPATTKTTASTKTTGRKTTTAKTTTTAPKAEVIKVRLTLVVELDPAKWEMSSKPVTLDPAPIVKALTDQGIPAEVAAEMAAKTVADAGKTGVNEVRTDVRSYLTSEAGKLAKFTGIGATVTHVASH